MHGFDSTYNDRLREAWGKFINNEPYDYSFIRPEFTNHGFVPVLTWWIHMNSKTALLPPMTCKRGWEDNKFLIENYQALYGKAVLHSERLRFYLLLADKDGYILDLIGDQDIIEARQVVFKAGGRCKPQRTICRYQHHRYGTFLEKAHSDVGRRTLCKTS